MSSLNANPFQSNISEKKWNGYYVPQHNAKILKNAILDGIAPWLPTKRDDFIPKKIINANTGFCVPAKDLLPLQVMQKTMGFSNNIVATYKTVSSISEQIKTGEKGFFYNFTRDDKSIGTSQYFFPEQTSNPEKLINFALQKEKTNSKNNKNLSIVVNSSEPTTYLSNYIAACKLGCCMEVKPNIAQDFSEKFIKILDNQLAKPSNRNVDIDKLHDFLFTVDKQSNQIVEKIYSQKSNTNNINQTLEPIKKEKSFEIDVN